MVRIPKPPISREDLRIDLYDMIDDMVNRTDIVMNNVRDLEYIESLFERENVINNTAFKSAIDIFQGSEGIAMQYLLSQAKEAVFETSEFNYDGYPDVLLNAIKEFAEIYLYYDEDTNTFQDCEINMSRVGNIEDYVNAVAATREVLHVGKMPIEWRSKKWKELYQAGREGATITVNRKNRKGEKVTKDVTAIFAEKYRRTIDFRLSFMEGKAPFWEILDRGTFNSGYPDTLGGTPYPTVRPTNFVHKAQTVIRSRFFDVFTEMINRVRDEYSRTISDSFGVSGFTTGIDDLFNRIEWENLDYVVGKKDIIKEAETYKIIEKVKVDEVTWEVYKTKTGKLGKRYSLQGNR